MQRVDPYGLVGQVLDGQFRVDAPIGEGGCSVVYRGFNIGLDAPVAIKCLKLQQQLGTAFVQAFEQRFRDESKIQYRLSQGSLHIVRTLAAGTTIAPATSALIPYMVLEWLDGFTLADQLGARRERGERGRLLSEVMRMLDPVAEAMAFAHSLGVVHRDLNPSNLFVVMLPDGTQRLKVVDFGVAKVLTDNALQLGRRAATLGPIRMFTPAYAAPEQFSETFGAVSPATDVYAFALLLVELLLDRPPIDGEHLSDYMGKAVDPVVRPTPWTLGCTTIGESVEVLLTRALSVDPTKRPPDIGAFWGALKNALSNDEELAKRRASQPPAGLVSVGGPTTKKGTLILRPEANTFGDTPTSSSIFAESTSNSRASAPFLDTPSHGHKGTLMMEARPPSMIPPTTQSPPTSPQVAPSSRPPGAAHLAGTPVTIRPPAPGQAADPLAPTYEGDPRPGASPLSVTVQPGDAFATPDQRAIIDRYWPPGAPSPFASAPGSSQGTPPVSSQGASPVSSQGSSPGSSQGASPGVPSSNPGANTPGAHASSNVPGELARHATSEPPRAPEPALTPSSPSRALLAGLGAVVLLALTAGIWLLAHLLRS